MIAEKKGLSLNLNELYKDYDSLKDEFNILKENPITIVKTKYKIQEVIVIDSFFIKSDSIGNNEVFFDLDTKYDDFNRRFLSGYIPLKIRYFDKDSVELFNIYSKPLREELPN